MGIGRDPLRSIRVGVSRQCALRVALQLIASKIRAGQALLSGSRREEE